MSYPKILPYLQKDTFIENFSLTPEDTKLIERIRSEKNILGFAVLLKALKYRGYPTPRRDQIPIEVVEQIAAQLELSPVLLQEFRWKGRVFKYHLSIIREYTGFRPCRPNEKGIISKWLIDHGHEHYTRKEFFEAAILKFRELKVELPAENKLRRLVNSSRQKFLNSLYWQVAGRLDTPDSTLILSFLHLP